MSTSPKAKKLMQESVSTLQRRVNNFALNCLDVDYVSDVDAKLIANEIDRADERVQMALAQL